MNDCISNEGKNQITRAIEVDGKAVGSIGIFVKDDVYEKSAELGYWLSEDYWRQGIVSSAARMLCREAFAAFDIVRIKERIKDVSPEQSSDLILYYYQGLRMWSRVIPFDIQVAENYVKTIREMLLYEG